MWTVVLSKIPSLLARSGLGDGESVSVSPIINCVEGAVIAVQVWKTAGMRAQIENVSGKIVDLADGDIIPVVLGMRRAFQGYCGDIPDTLNNGDTVSCISKSGIVGVNVSVSGGKDDPVPMAVLGSIQKDGAAMNIKHYSIPRQQSLHHSAPIFAVAGSATNTGKTTTAVKLISHFKAKGLRVGAAKLAGAAFMGELRSLITAGAAPVMSFADGGLPTTCIDPKEVVEVAMGVLNQVNQAGVDVIVVEIGTSLLGFYNVLPILDSQDFKKHLAALFITATDPVSAWGGKRMMEEHGHHVALITGPVVNNASFLRFVETTLGLPAESNVGDMSKLFRLADSILERITLNLELL
ncbi:hypothetical protein BDV25DRAFT_141057 [Aspergillus avenaceus]|uniref:P-loop containing nucleoside triphosphate hydrolase protein n=1 Tax=Aspergillus avenaceus TaxID=36643 RepID=A0A5N6TS45_ASPAV|nr:hypothetical protein BDV25DRAFT_141057 [Aspergillus avenaceus]